jgi:hypothetical protein
MKSKAKWTVGAGIVVAVVAPGVAQAAVISGSYFGYTTASGGWKDDTDRWAGKSSGRAKVCGDVTKNSYQFGGENAIRRDVNNWPDETIVSATIIYGNAYDCSSYAATSTNQRYFTRTYVVATTTTKNGYVEAKD